MAESTTITREGDGAAKRDRRVLIIFAKMEKARKEGRTLRLDWRELDTLWTVFGNIMGPAAEWAFCAEGADNPQPCLGTIIAEIGQTALATGGARG